MTERKRKNESKRKKLNQVVNYLASNTIDPQTGNPYTAKRIRSALEQAHVSIKNSPIADQIPEIVEKINSILPIKLETKKIKTKKFFKKFWWLLWKDDSFKGWAFSVVFLFLFIKFIFFPFLTLTTGTSMPLAIVESCSMYHPDGLISTTSDFDLWWENHKSKYNEFSIEKGEFRDFSLRGGFNKGDILFVIRANPEELEVGDVVIFNANQKNPVIHRIIEIKGKNGERIFSTFGDNNPDQISFEKEITKDQLVGKAVFKLAPCAGWVKLMFYDWKNPPSERGLC